MSELRVNDVVIDEESIDYEAQYHPAETPEHAREMAKRSLVIGELCRQRARALNLDVPDTHRVEEQKFVNLLINAELRVEKPSSEECREYYETRQERFYTPPAVHAHHILFAATRKETHKYEQARSHARRILQDIRNDVTAFATLAHKHSQCSSAVRGGDLGKLSYGQNVWQFESVIDQQKTGLMDDVLETDLGVHVVFVEEYFDSELQPFEHVKSAIQNYLFERARQKATVKYLRDLIKAADLQGVSFRPSL